MLQVIAERRPAVALRRRESSDARIGAQVYLIVAGLLTLNVITALTLGEAPSRDLLFREALFTGGRLATVWFPVIMAVVAALTTLAALRTGWKIAGWTLSAVALSPGLGAVAASLRWEYLGYLGSDYSRAEFYAYAVTHNDNFGWWW